MNSLTPNFMLTSLGNVGSTILAVAAGVIFLEVFLWLIFGKWMKSRWALPIMLLTPAAIGLFALIVYPLFFELKLAFSNMSIRRFKNPTYGLEQGWNNLKLIFTEPVLKQVTFLPLFLRTFLWTIIQITFHVGLGLGLALLLNRKIKFRGLFRTLLVFPWAVPQIVAVLAWRGEFNFQYGYVNIMLRTLGVANPPQWMTDPFWNYVAVNIVNIWLGVPFMMVTLLGGLQSIDSTYYEAAEIDGASAFQRFKNVTLPLIKPVMTPAVILGIIWTFNNFNVPYLINQYELETSDILVTALFRAAFEYNRYGFAAAFALVIFAILLGLTVFYMRVTDFKPVTGGGLSTAAGEKRRKAAKAQGGTR
ncbi:MAG: sugar ABC transporter permease [Spirochaetaceae bacterium]|nr:sugar ABC transporter permease [Spirochaetaceae bacterium]